jgi:hypothetical protein
MSSKRQSWWKLPGYGNTGQKKTAKAVFLLREHVNYRTFYGLDYSLRS